MSDAGKKITVLGIGRCGLRILGELLSAPAAANLRLLAIDTDQEALDNCPIPAENKLLAGRAWRQGRGCGGNTLLGQRAVADERPQIEAMLNGTEMLFVTGGLGGGTASPAVAIVNSIANKLKIDSVFFLTIPFMLEGHSRRNIAERTLVDDLLPKAEAVLAIPNDLLFSVLPNTATLKEGFQLADSQMAGTILGIAAVFDGKNALATDYADLSAILRRRKSFCSVGIGTASPDDGGDRCCVALERMLHSPLLGGAEKITEADALIVSLLGGNDLQLGEAKQLLETTVRLSNPKAHVSVCASNVPELGSRIQLSVIAVKFDVAEEVKQTTEALLREAKARTRKPAAKTEQPTLFQQDELNCGVMDRTIPVIVNGENLDIPTFRRRKLEIVTSLNAAD